MNVSRALTSAALWVGIALAPSASAATPDSISGWWDATVAIRGISIPFRFDFTGEGSDFTG
jgi:hypothetical protein